ncbi:MAG TPA: TPM domain-containing protein [Accumulibacter sp.]|nr:TPM domain-containing protein [Accumulibacter sp.]HMW18691.1 TPM domain-containing protein [Accumulibacter sp.]HNC18793.1 TPM domain-containing protein [Accumulibacter sp.]HND81466.1 TPM domain-containing protein [Accumulibacter sp.]HNE13969.1 TPM domain-containing protein [Accumulibacter sp.]
MDLRRLIRHVVLPHWWVRRSFAPDLLRRIEMAVEASEITHRGELRVVLEANLPLPRLLQDQTTHARAVELFSQLRVWDTAENSGVLIYLQLIDRRVEIVADRGIDAQVGPAFWNGVCRQMEEAFKAEDFAGGMLFALDTIGDVLREHFPISSANADELPNRPLVL